MQESLFIMRKCVIDKGMSGERQCIDEHKSNRKGSLNELQRFSNFMKKTAE